MRSVHTTASVHCHWAGTSLPCLAFGTPGSCICSCVSFTLPLSCPPWLHGHYPLHRYYGDSDSCPAPFNTRAGILGSCSYASRHSISTHPMRPCRGNALFAPRRLGPRLVLGTTGGSSDFAHYSQSHQSHTAVSSLFCGCSWHPSLYGLSVRFQLLSTPPRGDAVTFSYRRLAPPERDFHPSAHAHSQAHERRFLTGF